MATTNYSSHQADHTDVLENRSRQYGNDHDYRYHNEQPSVLVPEYRYHHGTGEHFLVEPTVEEANRPRFSVMCCLCHAVDYFCIALVLGSLGGAFYLCYYLYNNNDGGG
jgi:hypothetical protein